MAWYIIGEIVKTDLTNGKTISFSPGFTLMSDERQLALCKIKRSRWKGKKEITIKSKPALKIPKSAKRLGVMENIFYMSATRNDYYKHDFKEPYPEIYKSKNMIYIKVRNPELYFDPGRGIVN